MLATAESELPSLPQVILRMLDACDENADYQDLGKIIGNDTALTARVLALANSSFFRRGQPVKSLHQALLRLGIENLRTLVITASLRQFLLKLGGDQWQQLRDFWRHSLATALLARALAQLTRYSNPEEAFLVGMLHNVGELVMLHHAGQPQPEGDDASPVVADAAEIGANMASNWGLSPLATDAIRYQQMPASNLSDTAHLVKLISLATRLAMSDKHGVDAAQTLFGLTAALTREISKRIETEVDSLAEGLGIALDADCGADSAREKLLRRLVQHGMVDQAAQPLIQAENEQSLYSALVHAAELLCEGSALIFVVQDEWLVAGAVSGWPELDLRLPLEPVRSLVARCVAAGAPQVIGHPDTADLTVDQQLLNLLESRAAYAVPVVIEKQTIGVIVGGFDTSPDADRRALLALLATRAGRAFQAIGERQPEPGLDFGSDEMDSRLRLRQLIHEVSNPVTVIRNYLGTLQSRLSENDAARTDLDVVTEELDRIATLLVQSRDLHEAPGQPSDTVDLVREVQSLMDLLDSALFANHDIESDVQAPGEPVAIAMSRGSLRQILLNLARNAAEAMPGGGNLTVSIRANVWQNGQTWAELTLEDDGPGLPESVRSQLFKPLTSSKGKGHSGLGLSIVKRLVDASNSTISCYTGTTGTGFRILIPVANTASQEVAGQ